MSSCGSRAITCSSPTSAWSAGPTRRGRSKAWAASLDDDPSAAEPFLGYRVYRASGFDQPFTLVSNGTTTDTFLDGVTGSTNDVYMVRAVKLEITPSGTYQNASQGAFNQAPLETLVLQDLGGGAPFTGAIDLSDGSITAGTDDTTFRTYSSSLTHTVSDPALVAGQTYVVRLYFADLQPGTDYDFDVSIEGQQVLTGFDLDGATDPFQGILQKFVVQIDPDGDLDVELSGLNPLLSAIEIVAIN